MQKRNTTEIKFEVSVVTDFFSLSLSAHRWNVNPEKIFDFLKEIGMFY